MKRIFTFLVFSVLGGVEIYSQDIQVTEIMNSNIDSFFSPAHNFDGWVEIHNLTNKAISLEGWKVNETNDINGAFIIPKGYGTIESNDYKLLWFDSNDINPLQVPFKLDVDGGDLYIWNKAGELVVSLNYPKGIGRVSFACNEAGEWGYCSNPTPGETNADGFAEKQLTSPICNAFSQIFENNITANVVYEEGATLRYTTDGTTPTLDNGQTSSDGIFNITNTTTLKFRAFREGSLPSEVVTRTFLKKEHDFTIPVVSVVTDSKYLYSDSVGIMVEGVNGIAGNGMDKPCNWNMDWNRPAHFSYIDCNGNHFEQDVDIEVSGGASRKFELKSIKLKGNKKYGEKYLNYPFFEGKPFIHNRALLLRNGGNDYSCKITDAALETIIMRSGIDIEAQSYKPIIYYLNGEFKGLVNLREPNNKHYVESNTGLDDDEIDMFKLNGRYSQLCGTDSVYNKWYELSSHANEEAVYNEILKIVDIDEYINYLCTNLYLGINDGWPRANCKAYRATDSGKFRYISFDLDLSFRSSTLERLLDESYYGGIIPKEVQILIGMLGNDTFRKKFIDTFCLIRGSVFYPEKTEPIIRELANNVESMMSLSGQTPWPVANAIIKKLAQQYDAIPQQLKNFTPLQLSDSKEVNAKVSSNNAQSKIFVNNINIPYGEFCGTLFLPIELKAIAPSGYVFEGWKTTSGSLYSKEDVITIENEDVDLVASFVKKADNEKTGSDNLVRINEISPANDCYVSDYYKKSDWIELYNTTSTDIDIAGMYLSDEATNLHKYQIESNQGINTIIPANGYLIIWCDKREAINQLHAPFKLNKTEGTVYLTSADDTYTDELHYKDISSSETIGHYPDGGTDIYKLSRPTIAKPNIYTSYNELIPQNPVATNINTHEINSTSLYYADQSLIVHSSDVDNKLCVVNTLGQVVYSGKVHSEERYSMSMLPAGMYIATVNDGQNVKATIKFLK